jgi:hypothetical protein
MALKKQATPKRWRSKEAKEIVAAVQRAGGQVERTASGHLKVIGPAGSAIVASAPKQRPRRRARCPQHPGHDQEQDRAGGVKRSAGRSLRRMLKCLLGTVALQGLGCLVEDVGRVGVGCLVGEDPGHANRPAPPTEGL